MDVHEQKENLLATIARPLEHTIEVRKSKFTAAVLPVTSSEEALAAVEKKREEHPKASHWCWAYALSGIGSRCSDDGEPSGSAGRPILQAIEGEELNNVCVVVTRYYGGTKLGTGSRSSLWRLCTRSSEIMRASCQSKALYSIHHGFAPGHRSDLPHDRSN